MADEAKTVKQGCGTCIFWRPSDGPTGAGGLSLDQSKRGGQCRRFPPLVTPSLIPAQGLVKPGAMPFTLGGQSVAPSTSADYWCGEWKVDGIKASPARQSATLIW